MTKFIYITIVSVMYFTFINSAHSVMFTNKWVNIHNHIVNFGAHVDDLQYSEHIPTNFRENKSDQVNMAGIFDEIKQDLKEKPNMGAVSVKLSVELRGSVFSAYCEPAIIITEKTNVNELNNRKLVTVVGDGYNTPKCTVTDLK
jgi:hypothetical protein